MLYVLDCADLQLHSFTRYQFLFFISTCLKYIMIILLMERWYMCIYILILFSSHSSLPPPPSPLLLFVGSLPLCKDMPLSFLLSIFYLYFGILI